MELYQIQPGVYDAPQITGHRVVKSMVKGTPGVEVDFRVYYPDGQGGWSGYSDTRATLWLSDGAVDRTFDALEYLGWAGSDIMKLDTGDLVLSGAQASIDVRAEEYKGEMQVRVAFVNKLGGGGGSLDAQTVDHINAKLASRRRSQPATAAPAAQPEPAPAAQPATASPPAAAPAAPAAPAQPAMPAAPAAPAAPPAGAPMPPPGPPVGQPAPQAPAGGGTPF